MSNDNAPNWGGLAVQVGAQTIQFVLQWIASNNVSLEQLQEVNRKLLADQDAWIEEVLSDRSNPS